MSAVVDEAHACHPRMYLLLVCELHQLLTIVILYCSDGQIKHVWNKDATFITIPLPFGGRSSVDMRLPTTLKTPSFALGQGFVVQSREYRIPPFTIPESYTLRVPLLGTFDISSNIYSNYYNWSAAYTLANTTKDFTYGLSTSYYMRANSVWELLSYNVQGETLLHLRKWMLKNTFKSLSIHCCYIQGIVFLSDQQLFKICIINSFFQSTKVLFIYYLFSILIPRLSARFKAPKAAHSKTIKHHN